MEAAKVSGECQRRARGEGGGHKQGTCQSVITDVFEGGGHQSEEGPALLGVYCSPLYKVWENMASKWGLHQGGGRRATPANSTLAAHLGVFAVHISFALSTTVYIYIYILCLDSLN